MQRRIALERVAQGVDGHAREVVLAGNVEDLQRRVRVAARAICMMEASRISCAPSSSSRNGWRERRSSAIAGALASVIPTHERLTEVSELPARAMATIAAA